MPLQNDNAFNTKEFNSFFAPRGNIVAKQVATPEQLQAEQSNKAKRDSGNSGTSGLLVQNSLSEAPTTFAQKNVQNINVQLAEKRTYTGLYYSISKVVNYMRMHVNGQFNPNGEFIQSIINAPKFQAIRSRVDTSKDLGKVYDMQFYLNSGPTGNKFLNELSEPLPGAVDKKEFIKRLDPAAAEAEVSRNMARMGFIDTDINPLAADTAAATTVTTQPIIVRDTTPLEAACSGRN